MSILFRYILRAFAMPATMCFTGLCSLTLLFMSFDLIGACFDPKANVTLQVASDFLLGTLSLYLEWLLPAVFLLATLYTMWQLCRHSELIAMRASGIGLPTIVMPILLTALLAAGLSFVNTEYYKPIAAARAMIIKNSDFRETGRAPLTGVGYVAPRNTHVWTIGELDPANPKVLRDVRITLNRPDGSKEVTYTAPVAKWLDGAWVLLDNVRATYYDELDTVILPPEGLRSQMTYKQLSRLPETPREIFVQNTDANLSSAADRRINRRLRNQTGLTTRQKNEDSYTTYNHYAAPISILLVTLFAIPAGIASGRQSVFRGILTALGLFLAYYAISALSMLLSNHDIIKPALAVSLPSIIFGGAALWLFRRIY